mgnify:CR=1 FL=1
MKQTPEQKEQARKRSALNQLCNGITMAWSMKGSIVWTWNHVYRYTSIPAGATQEHLNTPVTFADVKAYTQRLKDEQEKLFEKKVEVLQKEQSTTKSAPIQSIIQSPTSAVAGEDSDRNGPSKGQGPNSEVVVETEVIPTDKPCVENDYLLPFSPGEKKGMIKYWHQRKAAKEMLDNILVHGIRGQQLVAAAGYGKTFMVGAVLCRLKDIKFADDKTFGSTKYLYVTKNTVVEQTRRVFEKLFGLTMYDGFEVINYEALRSKAGQLWVKEEIRIEGGEEVIKWSWRPMLNPVVVIWDENHSLKNPGSTQHQVASAFNEIKTPVFQIFVSATPYMRVSAAKCFAVATHKDITDIIGLPAKLVNENWPTYAKAICQNSGPDEYNEAAVERLTKDLEKYIVRVRGVKPQFKAHNRVKLIKFATPEEQKYYDDTEERYYRELAKLNKDADEGKVLNPGILYLVLLTKRAVAAEYCRRYHFARYMYDVVKSGKASACAVKYKSTLIAIVKILVEEMGVPRDKISLVWGGGQTQLTKKQKVRAEVKAKAEALKAAGLSAEEMLKDLDLEDVEDRVIEELDPSLRLGGQDKEERQLEIDKFQSGKTDYVIYTFKAGGVGLSLHHTDELCTDWDRTVPGFAEWYAAIQRMKPENRPLPGKVRRNKSGFAIEEDIKFIPTKQRQTCMSVAYSGEDMVQSSGRVPRLTSLSDTEQDCLLYDGTVEVDIAEVYSNKLLCLSKVVKQNESWVDLILNPADRKRIVAEHIAASGGAVDGEDAVVESNEEEE